MSLKNKDISSRALLLSALVALALTSTACSTSLTTLTDARAYEPKEVQVATTMQVNVHTNVVGKAITGLQSANEQFDNGNDPINEENYRDWLDLVLAAALFRPATSPELMARVGVTDKVLEGIDVGFRTNFNLYKGDIKLQLWEDERQMQALSVMLGYAYHKSFVNSAVQYVTLTDFGRMDFDLQMLWGLNFKDIIKVTLAPHVILSRISAEQKIPSAIYDRLPEEITQYDPNQLFENEWLGYYGANSVFMVGYKYVFVFAEVTAMHLTATAGPPGSDFCPNYVGL